METSDKFTPLHIAAVNGRRDIAQELIDKVIYIYIYMCINRVCLHIFFFVKQQHKQLFYILTEASQVIRQETVLSAGIFVSQMISLG
jgi:ankyrin repeat protein